MGDLGSLILQTVSTPLWVIVVLFGVAITYYLVEQYAEGKWKTTATRTILAVGICGGTILIWSLSFLVALLVDMFVPLQQTGLSDVRATPATVSGDRITPTPTQVSRISWRVQTPLASTTPAPPTITTTPPAGPSPVSTQMPLTATPTRTPPPTAIKLIATPLPPCFGNSDRTYYFLDLYDEMRIKPPDHIKIQAAVIRGKYQYYELRYHVVSDPWSPDVQDWQWIVPGRSSIPASGQVIQHWLPPAPEDYYVWLIPFTQDGQYDPFSKDCKVRIAYR